MKSSNLYFVSACVAYGARIIDTVNNNGRVTFELEDCPEKVQIQVPNSERTVDVEYMSSFDDLFLLFSSKKLWFPPNYPSTIQDVKALIYAR